MLAFWLAFTKLTEQKVIKSCKSSVKGSLKVGFQLLFFSNYLLKGVSSSKRNMKGTYHQLSNLLLQLLKGKKGAKGCWKEITFFLMPSLFFCLNTCPDGGVLVLVPTGQDQTLVMWLDSPYIYFFALYYLFFPQLSSIHWHWGTYCQCFHLHYRPDGVYRYVPYHLGLSIFNWQVGHP